MKAYDVNAAEIPLVKEITINVDNGTVKVLGAKKVGLWSYLSLGPYTVYVLHKDTLVKVATYINMENCKKFMNGDANHSERCLWFVISHDKANPTWMIRGDTSGD